MKSAFSLLELIFSIVILSIIASFAVPKYLNTKEYTLATTIKRDIFTLTTSLQSYYLLNRKIDKISDAVTLNTANWEISDKNIVFKQKGEACVNFSVGNDKISIVVSKDSSSVCKKIDEIGIKTQDIDLI